MKISRRSFVILSGLLGMSQVACASRILGGYDVNNEKKALKPSDEGNLVMVSDTYEFNPEANAIWCVSFQLVWDEMLKSFRDGEPLLDNGNLSVEALNTANFHGDGLSDDSYYTYSGYQTVDAKSEIESVINTKFNQSSHVLNTLPWYETGSEEAMNHWLLYSMLHTNFYFNVPFMVREHETFGSVDTGNLVEDVTYFGYFGKTIGYFGDMEFATDDEFEMYKQVSPLFWVSDDCFGVVLSTKSLNKCYVVRGCEGLTFSEVWDTVRSHIEHRPDNVELIIDNFKMPRLSINTVADFTELQGVQVDATHDTEFVGNGDTVEISQAVQGVSFSLNEFGGEVGSEAAVSHDIGMPELFGEHHDFFFDNDFYVFIARAVKDGYIESNVDSNLPVYNGYTDNKIPAYKYVPYMAVHVCDISEFMFA